MSHRRRTPAHAGRPSVRPPLAAHFPGRGVREWSTFPAGSAHRPAATESRRAPHGLRCATPASHERQILRPHHQPGGQFAAQSPCKTVELLCNTRATDLVEAASSAACRAKPAPWLVTAGGATKGERDPAGRGVSHLDVISMASARIAAPRAAHAGRSAWSPRPPCGAPGVSWLAR